MLIINNDIVSKVLSMDEVIEAQESAFKKMATGAAIHRPRVDMYFPCRQDDGYFRWGTMEGANDGYFAIRMKSDIVHWPMDNAGNRTEEKYCREPGTYCGVILLISTENGEPLAFINDGILQHMRVGGCAGLGVKYLARENSHVVGMLGSGGMARTFLEAFACVRDIRQCRVYSPTPENREAFAEEMSRQLGFEVVAVDKPRDAVRGVDILSACSNSMKPVFDEDWLEPGMHVTNVGSREMPAISSNTFDVVIRQGINGMQIKETDRIKSGIGMSPMAYIGGSVEEMKRLPEQNTELAGWGVYPDFVALVTGEASGRTRADQVSYYRNAGNQGLQFSAVGQVAYRKAREKGLGIEIPTDWFLQDIRD